MQKPFATAEREIKSYDPIWSQVRREAEEISAAEPALGGFIYATVLDHKRLEDAVCHRLARRLQHSALDSGLLHKTFHEVLESEPQLGDAFRADLMAVAKRDPACSRLIEPLLYFKGFHALETYRIAHALWQVRTQGLRPLSPEPDLALPAGRHPPCGAVIGKGIMFDHATGIVIGETAVIGDNCSMLHGVTLGGTGNERGDRHPEDRARRDDGGGRQDPRQYHRSAIARGSRPEAWCCRTCRRGGPSPACRRATSALPAARSRRSPWTR